MNSINKTCTCHIGQDKDKLYGFIESLPCGIHEYKAEILRKVASAISHYYSDVDPAK